MSAGRIRLATVAMAAALGMAVAPAAARTMAPGDVYAIGQAEAPLPIPVTGATPRFERASWARAVLHRHGVAEIRSLARIGDYWEAAATEHGRPIVVYLLDNGNLSIRHYSRAAMAATFGAAG